MTKSGTNSFHGAAWEFLRIDIFDSRNYFASKVEPLKQNQFGFSAGGPLRKNRLWFYTAYRYEVQDGKLVVERPILQDSQIADVGYVSEPGIIIGRKGAEVEKLKNEIQSRTAKEVYLNIEEVVHPELDAQLVAENVALQLQKRVAFRRAMKKAVTSALRLGADGFARRRSSCSFFGSARIDRKRMDIGLHQVAQRRVDELVLAHAVQAGERGRDDGGDHPRRTGTSRPEQAPDPPAAPMDRGTVPG